ncbi:mercuric transporter MerT family protein [Sneathiella sp.]|uniref:mercuric transporter MerT family protein n=1 Tax=Sneathiella sp. TaxID=1964365 RepID=UPI003565D668
MSRVTNTDLIESAPDDDSRKAKLIAAGGILGAIAASTCCIIPLVLFSLGISGAWIGQLTALSAYQPIFIVITLGFLGYGYWLVYRKPKIACAEGEACARPLPNIIVKTALWFATALILLAFAWPYLLPLILGS